MSVIPQWKVPTLSLELRWGFDDTVTPNWLMVPYRETKQMLLEFGKGKVVKSAHPNIADVSHNGDEGNNSFWDIEGKLPGRARIEVWDPRTGSLGKTLAVRVKTDQVYGVCLNFVKDPSGTKTTLDPSIGDDLITRLNEIYFHQTNIKFEKLFARWIEVDMILGDVIQEEKDLDNNKTAFSRISGEWHWKKTFTKFADNGFNVYFVPASDPTKNETLVYTHKENTVIEDGRQPPIYTLAHAIGRMLGAPVITDPNKMNQLMFWQQDLGPANDRSDDFIGRDTANIMNP